MFVKEMCLRLVRLYMVILFVSIVELEGNKTVAYFNL